MGADAGLLLLAGVGALFAVPGVTGAFVVVSGFVLLAVGRGVDVGVGVCEDVACPGGLVAEAEAVVLGARVVVVAAAAAAALAFAGAGFFAGAAALVSSPEVAALADLEARGFGAGLTVLAAAEAFSEELGAAVFVDACLGFAAVARVDFGFLSTASLTVSLTTLTCSLVAWAFFGRVVETCRMLWYRVFVVLTGATPAVNHPLLHLDKSCVLGPNLNILSIFSAESWCERNGLWGYATKKSQAVLRPEGIRSQILA